MSEMNEWGVHEFNENIYRQPAEQLTTLEILRLVEQMKAEIEKLREEVKQLRKEKK